MIFFKLKVINCARNSFPKIDKKSESFDYRSMHKVMRIIADVSNDVSLLINRKSKYQLTNFLY